MFLNALACPVLEIHLIDDERIKPMESLIFSSQCQSVIPFQTFPKDNLHFPKAFVGDNWHIFTGCGSIQWDEPMWYFLFKSLSLMAQLKDFVKHCYRNRQILLGVLCRMRTGHRVVFMCRTSLQVRSSGLKTLWTAMPR